MFHFTDDSEHHTWHVQFVCVTVCVILFYRSYKFCWAIVARGFNSNNASKESYWILFYSLIKAKLSKYWKWQESEWRGSWVETDEKCPGRLMKMECPILFSAPSPPHHFIFRSVAAPGKTAMLKCCLLVLRRGKIRVPEEKTSLSRKRKQN